MDTKNNHSVAVLLMFICGTYIRNLKKQCYDAVVTSGE